MMNAHFGGSMYILSFVFMLACGGKATDTAGESTPEPATQPGEPETPQPSTDPDTASEPEAPQPTSEPQGCLLYTSDAADES